MIARELVIDVPVLPPSALSVNRRSHWAARARATAEYGGIVRLCAVNARNLWIESAMATRNTIDVDWLPLKRCSIALVFTFPVKGRRGPLPDPDNLVSSCKCLIDALTARDRGNGCVGAGIIEDDREITLLPATIQRGEANVRITIEEVLR